MFLISGPSLIAVLSLYCSFSQLAIAIRGPQKIHADMMAPNVGPLMQLMMALPVLLPIMLLLVCVGLGFFIIRLRKRDTWEEDEMSVAKRRSMTILACIGVDLFIISYVGIVFFLFQFLVEHVELLR